jgi:hypothetical protein
MRRRSNKDNLSEDGRESTTASMSNRPKDNILTQQRLPALKPTLNAKTVLPLLFVIGIVFIPIGVAVLITSLNIKEKVIDYTDCNSTRNAVVKCKDEISKQSATERDCFCSIPFTLEEDWEGEVFMYYGLENFYQNHRLYFTSKVEDQLLGEIRDYDTTKDETNCKAYYKNDKEEIYFPCGSIANSMFSDVITMKNNISEETPLIRKGIAWESDKKHKFKNPNASTPEEWEKLFDEQNFAKPNHWKKNLWELDINDPSNNGLENEDLIVWMRIAALPNFRKLYRKIHHIEEYANGLPKGEYTLEIEYNFEVVSFKGRKNIVLTTQSLLGGRNLFLGIAYIVVGGICIILGIVFLFIHCKWGAKIYTGTNVMRDMSQ